MSKRDVVGVPDRDVVIVLAIEIIAVSESDVVTMSEADSAEFERDVLAVFATGAIVVSVRDATTSERDVPVEVTREVVAGSIAVSELDKVAVLAIGMIIVSERDASGFDRAVVVESEMDVLVGLIAVPDTFGSAVLVYDEIDRLMMRVEVASAPGMLVLTRFVVEVMSVVGKIELLSGRLALVSLARSDKTETLKQAISVQLDDRDGVALGLVVSTALLGRVVVTMVLRTTLSEGVENNVAVLVSSLMGSEEIDSEVASLGLSVMLP